MKLCQCVIILCVMLVMVSSCGDRNILDAEFRRIDRLCDSIPEEAIVALDSIDPTALPERDRHHFDLLRIKSRDKAYISHTSDSLILDVISYFSDHKDKNLYPEALYYGGRVYSDMGEYGKALEYFRKSLDVMPVGDACLAIKGRALSQIGHLLVNIGLHSEAIPYIEEAIVLAEKRKDSISIAYNHINLTGIYINKRDTQSARSHISQAERYSRRFPDCDKAWLQVVLAEALLIEGKVDSALSVIRPQIDRVDSICYNYTLANAAEIYLYAGLTDTAYMYARELVETENDNNRKAGYQLLFKDDLKSFITPDSLKRYLDNYVSTLQTYHDNSESMAMILHKLYESKGKKSEKHTLWYMAAIILLLIVVTFLALKFQLKKRRGNLANAQGAPISARKRDSNDIKYLTDNDLLAIQKKASLMSILNAKLEGIENITVAETIKNSPVFEKISISLKNGKSIANNEKIWAELSKIIRTDSPDFISNLKILTLGRITKANLHTAFLIRCGFSPSDLVILFSISKSSVSDRRSSLSRLIFEDKNSIDRLDKIISLL